MGGKKKENVAPVSSNTSNAGSLSAAFNRRKTMLATNNSQECSDVEEDCGFKFQRKQQPASPALKKVNKTKPTTVNAPTTANKVTENKKLRNRRKSLIASSAVANARRKSSITIPLSQGFLYFYDFGRFATCNRASQRILQAFDAGSARTSQASSIASLVHASMDQA